MEFLPRANLNDRKEIIMAGHGRNTPSGVPGTPFVLPISLVECDAGLALVHVAIAADAAAEVSDGDPNFYPA
ncbi:hypothetical protein SAMN04488003_11915 [Loktanella fryxellensis]|uniref:Uncharacterized protein n=1 Tax=Loktanella fryxellensis TaxID=245187 RepID=A0A1H8H300_9RHOB|nr:hypothetical protein [Loktanella fryxellensis]SEN50515.1 hypothetical protein SAMN04488003_11915 [Loktanella fryxellensis]